MKPLYLILLILIPMASMANSHWNEGIIILKNNEILEGAIKYDQKHEIIQIKNGEIIKAYSSYHVDYFEFHDEQQNTTRKFSTCEKDNKTTTNRKIFYEVVLEGDFTLLRKDVAGALPAWITDTFVDNNNEYAYYINQDNSIMKLTDFKKQVLPLMADQKTELEHFINKNNFNFSSPTSQILIINYYNHLKKNQDSVSRI